MNAAPGTARERHSILISRLLGSSQWERALSTARDWLAEEPEAPVAHRAAAQALVNLGRYKLATSHLQTVLAANPNDDFAWRLASVADFQQHRYDRAHENIQRALRLRPRNAWHWFHLATMHGGKRLARRYAQRALELAPNEATILHFLAQCEPYRSPQRLARLRDALKLEPENAAIHHNIGEYLLQVNKNYAGAAQMFRQVLALEPEHQRAQEGLFVALREMDPTQQALRWPNRLFERYQAIGERPGMGGALFTLLIMTWFNLIAITLYLPCAVFALPLAGAYGFLLERDLRVQVGVAGSRRGGFLNFWKWPRRVRVGLLFLVYVAGWAGVLMLISHGLCLLFR